MGKPTWARLQAIKVIQQVNSRQAFVRPLIDSLIRTASISSAERDFAILLALGVTATSGELDLIIKRSIDTKRLDTVSRSILQLATYELVYLQKEAYVAVDQAVALAHQLKPKVAGFINWAMHRIIEQIADFPWGDPSSEIDALVHQTAFPLWLANRLIAELGWTAAAAFMHISNEVAPLDGADLTTGQSVSIDAEKLAKHQSGIAAGELIIADQSSQFIAHLTAQQTVLHPNCQLLEIGSGRGTKTVLINRELQRLGVDEFVHYALEYHTFKTKVLVDRIKVYRLRNVQPITADILLIKELIEGGMLPPGLDVVMIDAPCSGSGTLRRNPEIRWRLSTEDITAMSAQGLSFLLAAAPYVNPGGCLVYSTCSIFTEENEKVIEAFLDDPAGTDFILTDWRHSGNLADWGCTEQIVADSYFFHSQLRSGGPDSHFAAILRRRA